MDVSISRVFRPTRIVALALIAVLVGGLAYLGFASARTDPVLMPQGDVS